MTNYLGTTRHFDKDGRLHIGVNNITKAQVSGYLGSEIMGGASNGASLNLIPDKLYYLLRSPEELERAASTANNIQLLRRHVGVNAANPKKDDVIGSTGTDAVWAAPYVQNSLVVWDAIAIRALETGEQDELSCSYHYEADMTPGTYEGEKYDGTMRNIVFNHVAAVEKGRAGPDVAFGDSAIKPKDIHMPIKLKAALAASAADFRAKAAELEPKLANDAALRPLHKTYLKLAMDAEEKAEKADEDEIAKDGDPLDLGTADDEDETEEERKEREAKEKAAKDKAKDEEKEENRKAMDAAVKSAETNAVARVRGIQAAEKAVRPWVGEINTLAMDSGEAVYKAALDLLKVDVTGVHPSAYAAILSAQPKPGDAPAPRQSLAMDAAGAKSFAERFPSAARINTL